MGWFSTTLSEKESALEKALQGMLVAPEKLFYYDGTVQKKELVFSQVCLIPVDCYKQVAYGFFWVDGRLTEVIFDFVRKTSFFSQEHYQFDTAGGINKADAPNDGTLYLPLQLTDFVTNLGEYKDEKFVQYEGAPFRVFGLNCSQGLYPVILVAETEKGVACRGVYKSADNCVRTYAHNKISSQKDVRNLISQFKRGVASVSTSQVVLIEKTAQQSGAAKVAVQPDDYFKQESEINWEQPKTIVKYLDQFVVGQDDAKVAVAVAFSNYMVRVKTKDDGLPKDNILLIGPSGVGKTYLISLLAQKAALPMLQTKLTGKSSEGYKGENLSTIFAELRKVTQGDAPYAIVFFDEIDKLAQEHFSSLGGFGDALQDELIGWLEEASIATGKKDADDAGKNSINTKNILFVTAGAFGGREGTSLDDIVRKRIGEGIKQMGFGVQEVESLSFDNVLQKTRPDDLIMYGLKTELVGRLPAIGILNPLTTAEKTAIITKAKRSPIAKYLQLLEIKGFQVKLEPEIPEILVGFCPEETGARAIQAICNDLFTEILYEPEKYADKDKVIRITPALARQLVNLYC